MANNNGNRRLNGNKKLRRRRKNGNGNGNGRGIRIPMPAVNERIFPGIRERSITPEIPLELFD